VPKEGKDGNDDTDESDSEPEVIETPAEKATEKHSEDAPTANSPLLTAHRVSVTSDMTDVSLEGGKYHHLVLSNHGVMNIQTPRASPHKLACFGTDMM